MKKNNNYNSNRNLAVLTLISIGRRTVLGETYCSLSQKEMAKALGYAQHEIYQTIKELSESGLIIKEPDTVRKYSLTESGKQFVNNPTISKEIKCKSNDQVVEEIHMRQEW
ncbi:MAG: hypothetical protein E7389_01220 [Ruminococcaceae bacterium]|nr:hypothetical protein [Oscillospiraceae bacterium]